MMLDTFIRKWMDDVKTQRNNGLLQRIALYRLDIIISILGLVGGVIVMSLYLVSPTAYLLIFGGAFFCASLVYLTLDRIKCIENGLDNFFNYRSARYLLEAFFLVLFAMSLISFHASDKRTIFYFIFISICAGIVALLCIGVIKKLDIIIQIINIILLSLNIKLTKYYFFGGSGTDYWTHLRMNEMLSQLGNIGFLIDKEQYFPIMHINVAIAQIVSSLSIKDASMFSITIPLIISSVCVYLIGRELFSENIGLLGMLIVNISDYHNSWGVAPQTTSYGVIIFFYLMFALYKIMQDKNKIEILIITLILMFTMIAAHAISSFILLMAITGLKAGSLIYNLIFFKKRKFFAPMLLLIYSIGLIQHWFIADYREGGNSFFNQIFGSLTEYIIEKADFLNRPEAFLDYKEFLPPLSENLVNNLGLALLIFLAAIGSLFWLSSKFRSEETFSILVCATLLLCITLIFPLFGLRNIIPFRWFVFEYLFLGIMAAFATIQIAKRMNKNQQIFVIFVLFTCLSFFMLTSALNNHANQDSPLWLKEYTISPTYTVQEIKGAETISRYSDKVFSDLGYGGSILEDYYGIQHSTFNSMDLSNRIGDIFIWREYMVDRPIRMFTLIEGYYKRVVKNVILGSGYKEELELMHDKIYENDEASGYYIHGVNN